MIPLIDTADDALFFNVIGIDALGSVICVPGKVRVDGFSVSAGTIVSIPWTDVAPVVAVTVTGVEELTVPPVTENV